MPRTNVLQFHPRPKLMRSKTKLPKIDLVELLHLDQSLVFRSGGKLLLVEQIAPQPDDLVVTEDADGKFMVKPYQEGQQTWGTVRYEITSVCEVAL